MPISKDQEKFLDDFLTKETPPAARATPGPGGQQSGPGGHPDTLTGDIERLHDRIGGRARPGASPSYRDMDWQQAAGAGVAKGVGILAHQGGKLLEHFAPEGATPWLEENIPGVRRFDQWAERQYKEPYRGPAEKIGSYLTQGAATLLGPSKFVKGGKIAQAAETAARGAFGGALADPDHPVRGAALGAPAGFAGPLAQRALQSPMGRFIGGHIPEAILGSAAYAALRHVPGGHVIMAGLIWPSIHWSRSPFGRNIRRWGERIIDEFGNTLGRVNPEAGGYAAGKADQAVRPRTTSNPFGSPAPQPPAEPDAAVQAR
jgi:hypothetical protein